MRLRHLFAILGYFFLLGLGAGNRLAYPQEIRAAAEWNLFTTLPPTPIQQSITHNLATPFNEIILPILPDMTLAHVNKTYALPSSYVPSNLTQITGASSAGAQFMRADILPYFYQLIGAAQEAGHNLMALSAYRSYATQVATFNYWVSAYGLSAALAGSARPGHSEHQLGTTVDLALLQNREFAYFTLHPAAGWVAKNAHKFGFVVSYPQGKQAITGYIWEPWHIRFVGIELATKLYQQSLTLEEYLSSL